jgi:hypothetical protein
MILILAFVVALVLHVLLGWPWSIVGGFVAGIGSKRGGWALGLMAVALSWIVLIVYNFAVAPEEMARFVEVTSGLLGNMDGPMLVVTTVLLGALLGLLGGGIGSLTRSIVDLIRQPAAPSSPESADPIEQTTNTDLQHG